MKKNSKKKLQDLQKQSISKVQQKQLKGGQGIVTTEVIDG